MECAAAVNTSVQTPLKTPRDSPDSHRVNVLEVPIDGLLRGDVVEVGLIEL